MIDYFLNKEQIAYTIRIEFADYFTWIFYIWRILRIAIGREKIQLVDPLILRFQSIPMVLLYLYSRGVQDYFKGVEHWIIVFENFNKEINLSYKCRHKCHSNAISFILSLL